MAEKGIKGIKTFKPKKKKRTKLEKESEVEDKRDAGAVVGIVNKIKVSSGAGAAGQRQDHSRARLGAEQTAR